MGEQTPNHGLNRFDPGETNWSHTPDMETIEERLTVRDVESARSDYEPHPGATFVATDTGAVYDGNGEAWTLATREFGALQPESIATNHVFDTSGRVHGELTGSNDAQVVIDAIEDRPGTVGIVVPDPGFPLEWDQQVDLPPNERGFSIESVGLPELRFPNDFDGEYAIYKPPKPAGESRGGVYNYRIGEFVFDDGDHEVLSWAIYLDDTKGALVRPSMFDDTPAVKIGATSQWSNQNLILRPYIRTKRGPGIELERGDPQHDEPEGDQNWIVAPYFSDKQRYTETAFVDHGRGNMWLFSRVEFAGRIHHQLGAHRYVIVEGQWDRYHSYPNTVVEDYDEGQGSPHGDVYGTILIHHPNNFAKARLINAHTKVQTCGRLWGSTEPIEFTNLTNGHTLAAKGLRDASEGGSVTIETDDGVYPAIALETDGEEGDVARLDSGGNDTWGSPKIAPKLFLHVKAATNEDVLARVGFYGSEDDRVELLYDPNEVLGSHGGIDPANWYLEVVTDGTVRGRADTGVDAYGWGRSLVLQRESIDAGANWSAVAEKGTAAVVSNDGVPLEGRFGFRVQVEALESVEKQLVLSGKNRRFVGLYR